MLTTKLQFNNRGKSIVFRLLKSYYCCFYYCSVLVSNNSAFSLNKRVSNLSHFRSLSSKVISMSQQQATSTCESNVDDTIRSFISQRLYQYNNPQLKYSIHITGGSVGLANYLLTVSGASKSIQTVEVPYSVYSSNVIISEELQKFQMKDFNLANISSCSSEVAYLLAKNAYDKALQSVMLSSSDHNHSELILGVGITANLVTNQPKRGNHRCFIALYSPSRSILLSVMLDKTKHRTRVEEDAVCSMCALRGLQWFHRLHSTNAPVAADGVNLPLQLPVYHLHSQSDALASIIDDSAQMVESIDHLAKNETAKEYILVQDITSNATIGTHEIFKQSLFTLSNQKFLEEVCQNKRSHVFLIPGTDAHNASTTNISTSSAAQWVQSDHLSLPPNTLVFPGSFNPLHEGHVHMALTASQFSQPHAATSAGRQYIVFEIAIINADKPMISSEVVYQRLEQFSHEKNPLMSVFKEKNIDVIVCVSANPYFTKKATIMTEGRFLVGADTLIRLFDLKYYPPNELQAAALAKSRIEETSRHLSNFNGSPYDSTEYQIRLCNLVKAFTEIQGRGFTFVVAGRVSSTDSSLFETMEMLIAQNTIAQTVFQLFPNMFTGIPEESFRNDISSTIIRQRMQQQQQQQNTATK